MEKRAPILGVACAFIASGGILLPFVLGPELTGKIDLYLRYAIPVAGLILVTAAIVRRERFLWVAIGTLLTMVYVGLHLLAYA
jgi:hypothetical protein